MLTSMLIGLDGSADAKGAMELGLRWARQFSSLLVGIGIIDKPGVCKAEITPIGGSYYKRQADTARIQSARAVVKHLLQEFADRCMEAGVAAQILEEEGLPHEQIMLEAQRFDVILLGQHTHFQWGTERKPDNTLYQVLKGAPCPVLAVPHSLAEGTTVMVAYDGSLQAARALHAWQSTAPYRSDPVHVLSIADSPGEASRKIDRASDYLHRHNIETVPHPVVTSADPADVLLEQSKQLHAGLIVMGAYGQPTIRELFLGSVTRRMIQEETVPLFLYH